MLLQVFCLALTKDINLLETKKYDDSVDATDILAMEKEVSKRYLFLAQVLSSYPDLERECILTAFSMNPTAEFFELVCTLAEHRQHVRDKSEPDRDSELETMQTNTNNGISDEPTENICPKTEFIDALHVITNGTQILESKDYNAEVAPSRLIDELTMLSESVRHDLTCMLSVTRIKNLTWLTPWHKLKEECAQLLENEQKKRIVEKTTAAANAKLQYLKLNYDEFKDFKPHQYPGIEKGYEMYVPDSSSDESIPRTNRDSDDTDTAPESKLYKTREARRLSAKKRRKIRQSKQILEQLEDDHETHENRARIIDGDKKKKAIENMLNVEGALRPRRPRAKTMRPRKKKVKVEQSEENKAGDLNAVENIKTEEIAPELIGMVDLMQPQEHQTLETPMAVTSTPPIEDDVRQFLTNQNVLQAVSDILGESPNLISTNGIELLEEIIGTKPEVSDICLEDIFDPETGALTIDCSHTTINENGQCAENAIELNNVERDREIGPKIDECSANEPTLRKRLSNSEEEMLGAKRRLSENVVTAQSQPAIEQLNSVIAPTDQQIPQHQQQISNNLVETNAESTVEQMDNNLPAEQPTCNFPMLEPCVANETQTELIQNTSIDHIENSIDSQLSVLPRQMPTNIDGLTVLTQLQNQHIFLPQVDLPFFPSHLMHLPLLPVATPSPTKEKPRNPLLAFRIIKCSSPADQAQDQTCASSSGTDGPMPMSRRDSLSAMSFSSSGDHTSDSLLTAASNGPEILTKHCTISLQRIEDIESLSHYLRRDSPDPVEGHSSSVEASLDDNNSNQAPIFLGSSMQPMVVLKPLDANQLVANECNSIRDKRTINGCNDETAATASATCRETTNANSNDSNVLREIKQNSQSTPANLHFNSTAAPSNDMNGSSIASSISNFNKNIDDPDDIDDLVDDQGQIKRNFGDITTMKESNATSNDMTRDGVNLKEEADDNDDEDEDDDEGRKSVEIDNYGAMNNHNGYHNHDDDDDDYNNGKEEQKKTTCGITIEFSVSNGNRNGDGGSGSSDGNGQHQTQQQRCHQQTTPSTKNQSQQSDQNTVETVSNLSWNYIAAPVVKLRHMTEVSNAFVYLNSRQNDRISRNLPFLFAPLFS